MFINWNAGGLWWGTHHWKGLTWYLKQPIVVISSAADLSFLYEMAPSNAEVRMSTLWSRRELDPASLYRLPENVIAVVYDSGPPGHYGMTLSTKKPGVPRVCTICRVVEFASTAS